MHLTEELRTHFGSAQHAGVLVARVEPGSPASRAGIRVGDVLVEVRGRSIDSGGDVVSALADVGKDRRASVRVLRDKKPISIDVQLDGELSSALETWPGIRWLRDVFQLGNPDRQASST